MASYLQVEHISKSYGDKILLNNISFNINQGDKIALIAPNGSGKSTLLSILAGKDSSDMGGEIKFMKDITIAYLEQDYDFDKEATILDEVFTKKEDVKSAISEYYKALESSDQKRIVKAIAEIERLDCWNYEQKIKEVLTNLKLTDFNKKMKQLSGGEVKRVAIAGMILKEADFLVMDEPTNHLDIEIIEYLEEYLSKSKSTLFMVTHDRYFLDRVCNTILELDKGELYLYKGNYSYFLEKREERIANATAEVEKARNLFRRELEWIRSTPCARTGKAKYRIDAFNSLKEKTVGDVDEKKININVKSSRLGTKIINCKDVSFSYSDRPMLKEFTYNFARGEKVGIVGDNGVGKSTFLKLLCGDLEPQSGELSRGETLVFGHYRQEGISFNENDTIFDAVHDIAEVVTLADGKQVPVSTFLNYFLFPPQTHRTKISRLSGGEKRRLYLLTILMKNPNFLILDEPTNDLDIITLNVLEEYLESFSGSLLIVSHDRYFLDKIADHIFIFKGNGEVKDFVGKYSEYRAIQDYEKENSQTSEKSKKSDNKEYKKEQPEKKKRLSFKEQRLYDQLTLECSNLEEEKLKLETELNNGSLPIDKLTEASKRIGEIMDLLDEKTLLILELEESISI